MSLTSLHDARELRTALDELARRDEDLAAALARLGYPAPRVREPGFATLLQTIVAQQISTASAAALWRKLEAALPERVAPGAFLGLDDAALRACGFSARKAEYGRALAGAVLSGALPLDRLARLDDEAAVAALSALRGFGRWSAEVYLLFAQGRADVFPADDLALQIGYQRLRGGASRPAARALRTEVLPWAPWRGAGALMLWHVYGAATLDFRSPPSRVKQPRK